MFQPQSDCTYLMPIHFGGGKFDPELRLTQRSATVSISYETERSLLKRHIPEGFELLAPVVQVAFNRLTEISWMQGGQYRLINVAVPVRFHGKKDTLDGTYPLVVWENKTAPILGGREQTGIPKIYADVEDLHIVRPYYTTTASNEGCTFLTMNFEAAGALSGTALDELRSRWASVNTIGWRYIPKVGAPGAELSQFILYPQGINVESAQTGKGSLTWLKPGPMQNPTQAHIINALASLPVVKVTEATLMEGMAILHAMGARVIE